MTGALLIRIKPDRLNDDKGLMLRVSPDIGDGLLRALQSAGYDASRAAEFSSGATEFLIALHDVLNTVGGLAGLATLITAAAHRNDGRSVTIEDAAGNKLSVTGATKAQHQALIEMALASAVSPSPSGELAAGQRQHGESIRSGLDAQREAPGGERSDELGISGSPASRRDGTQE